MFSRVPCRRLYWNLNNLSRKQITKPLHDNITWRGFLIYLGIGYWNKKKAA
jgi:hypothetical protein